MISGADEDGRVMVEFSEPVGGRRVKMLTPDEINGMLYKEETSESPANAEEAMAEETEPPTAGQEESGESALERIPKDAQTGEPQYTQTDAPTAWDAIVEQTEGDEDMARSVVDSTVRDKEAALKKLESSNPKPGATVAEKIAAAKEHKAAIEAARQELDQWKAIAEVENSRKAEAEAKAKAEEEEAKAKAKAEEERTALKGVNLSEEKDENGNSFVVSSDGTTTFGEVRDKSGLPAAPIKLSVGYQDKNGSGYGLTHIEANHGAQIKKEGFASVEDFVSYVAKNYDENNIKVGKRRTGGSITYLLQVTGKHDNTLFIELSRDGSYWNVNSAGVFRKGYSDKKETVAKTEPQQPSNAISERALQSADQSNGILPASPNGKPTVSTSKVSESPETKQEKAENSISARVKEASADVNTAPTEAQKEAGNYKKGHVQVGAFDITIEQPEGSIRRGTDADGKQWESKMHNTYGYFRGTEGVDGDHIDVFLSNDMDVWNGAQVFVVDQYNPDGTFDEHKVMLGFNDASDAKNNYLANYEKGWENGRRIDVSAVSLEDFEKWIASSHRKTKPFSEYKSVKPADDSETFKGNKVENSGKDTEAQIKHLEEIKDYPGADKKIVQSEIDRLKAKEEAKAKSKSEEVKSKSEEKNGVDDAKIEAVSEALSKGDEKAEQLVQGLTSRELSKLRSKVKASPPLENEWLHRVRTRGDVSLHDWLLENQYVEPVKRVSGTFKMTDYTAPKKEYEDRLSGVYHDDKGYAVATDARILVASKDDFDPKLKGKVIGKDGAAKGNEFPNWQKTIPAAKETKSSRIDVEDLHRFVAGVLKADKHAYISLRFPDGTTVSFQADKLNLMLRAMKRLGADKLLYAKYGTRLVAKSDKGAALLIWRVSAEDELMEEYGYAYPGNTVSYHRGEVVSEMSQEERVLRDAVIDRLRESGMEVITDEEAGQRVLDEANGKAKLSAKKRRALETASLGKTPRSLTVVSSADGAKILKSIDTLVSEFEKSAVQPKTFIGDVAKALGAKRGGSASEYASFETKNGKIITIRLSNHNAKVSNFDANGETDGISIVVSPKKSGGMTNDGKAHVVEYYYDAIKLRRAEGKPLADIVRSIKQALYSGEFEDTTGLAERQEVNAEITDRVRFFRTAKGEAYGFTVGGKIYIDPKIANTETPIHEYAHLWAAALRGQNPKEWQNIVELMKGTSVWDEVKKRYPELNTDDDIADEVLATYSGRRGAERLREEQRKIAGDKGGVFEKAEAISALERVKQALRKFWKSVADFLHIHYKSAKEVADRVMKDLLDGVDPNKAAREADFRDFAEKYGVDENLIKDYADAMERGDVFAANRGIQDIRRSLRIKNKGKSFSEFAIDVYRPVRKELYARFGNADELTKQYEEQIRRERLALDSARKRAEEEQRKRKEREAELEQMSDGERDRRYMEALAKGNETVARELLSAAARSKGYADIKSDYQGVGAWAAPSNPGFETDEERRASIDENGGEANVEDIALGHSPVEEVMFYHPERVGFGDATGIDAGHVISRAIDAVKRGGKNVKIKVYRAVPNAIKEGRLRNGDWVTPSKKYAQMHGENRLEGNYRIIEDEVPASQLWFDGNDVREWGFDDGKSYRYKNVKNNRKSDDLVTRDDNGNIIPPSKRFNSRNDDPRFMLADTKNSGKFSKKEDDIRYRMDESKSERIEKLRESKPVEITGDEYKGKYELNRESAKEWLKNNLRGEYRIKDTGETVELRKDGIQKVTSHSMGNEAHLKSLAAIPQMIENSIFIDEVPNEKNNGKYDRYRYYVCGLKIGGEDYTAKITIGVKGSYKYYDHSLTQIEKGSLLDNIDALSTTYDDKGTTLSSVGKDSRLLSILQVKDEKKPNDGLYRVGGGKELRDGRKIEFVRKPTATYNALARHLQAEGIKPDMHEAHTGSRYMSFEKDGVQWEVRSSDHTKPEYYGEAQKPVELTYYKDKQGEENLSVSVDLGTSGYNIEDMKALMAEIDRLKNDAGEVKESFDRGVVSDEAAKRYPLLSQALGVKSENEVRAKEEAREHAEEARKQEMRSAVEDMAGKLHLNNVDIVDKPAGRGAGRRERAKGMFERSTGRITINTGNCSDKRDAVVTLLHEAVAHHGLRKLFGENFETFLDNVYNSANAEIRRIIGKHSSRYGGDKRTATEEYMASLAERTDFENAKKSGWWQRIKDFFLKMLEKIGLKGFKGEDLSDNELRYVLWRSYENLKSGGKDTVFSAADDLAKQSELKVGEFAPGAKKTAPEENAEEVNERFNNELGGLTADNADNVVLSLGRPSKVLLSAGVENKPMKLYGNKVIKKMRKHGFALEELRNLPRAVADPIAVFNNYGENGNRSILTELKTLRGNFLVSVNIGKGADVDFNIVSSVFGKGSGNVADWINKGYMTYVDKEKALNYLHHSALRAVTSDSSRLSSEDPAVLSHQSAPIAATAANAEFSSAAKVVENFENPKPESKNDILFRDGAAKDYEKAQARETYERRVSTGMFQSREAIQDSMLSLKVAMDAIEEATAGKAKRIEDYDGFENAYLGENRLSSVNQAESAAFAHLLIRPMMEEVNRLAPTAEDRAELIDYMFAKHGLERNAYMRQQAAEKKLAEYKKQNPGTAKTAADFIDAERDYAGLTTLTGEADVSAAEAEAQRMVADYENDYTFHGTWNEIYVCRKKIC